MHSLKVHSRWLHIRQNNAHANSLLDESRLPTQTCLHCGKLYTGNFCPNCGQKSNTRRLTLMGIILEFFDLLTNFDRALPRTFRELFYRPGFMIRDYLSGHRICYFKPLQLLVFLTTVFLVIKFLFSDGEVEDEVVLLEGFDSNNELLTEGSWFRKLINSIANDKLTTTIIGIFLFSLTAKFCFRHTPYGSQMNLTEHFYARVYLACQSLIISICTFPFDYFQVSYYSRVLNILVFVLTAWSYAQLMEISFKRSLKLCLYTYFLMFLMVLILVIPIVIFFAMMAK